MPDRQVRMNLSKNARAARLDSSSQWVKAFLGQDLITKKKKNKSSKLKKK